MNLLRQPAGEGSVHGREIQVLARVDRSTLLRAHLPENGGRDARDGIHQIAVQRVLFEQLSALLSRLDDRERFGDRLLPCIQTLPRHTQETGHPVQAFEERCELGVDCLLAHGGFPAL